MLNILVDYDNIEKTLTSRGVARVIDEILAKIQVADEERVVRLKLYGGWYGLSGLTPRASQIVADLDERYPRIESVSCPSRAAGVRLVRVQVDLGVSLEAEPDKVLYFTYRERGFPNGIHCISAEDAGCAISECHGAALSQFATGRRCPAPSCTRTGRDFLFKGEQKMVDTLMVADIIHLSMAGDKDIVVVTSDDDMWPGIRVALLLSTRIVNIQTKMRKFPPRHIASAGPLFSSQLLGE